MNAKAALMLLGLNALISSAVLAAYARWGAPPPAPRLAVLDVGELYRLKESQVAAVLMQRDATDEARTTGPHAREHLRHGSHDADPGAAGRRAAA